MLTSIKKVSLNWFYIIAFLNLIPVLIIKIYATGDGGPHLFNASLIKNLLIHDPSPLHLFYEFNSKIVPNWIGDIFLAIGGTISPPWLAEKILQLVYLFLLPFSVRYYINSYNFKNNNLIFFIFPFTYNFNFYSGFYNFSFALILMFFILGINNQILIHQKILKLKHFLLFTFLLLLLYFSHFFVLGITVFSLGLHAFLFYVFTKIQFKRKALIKHSLLLLISFIPVFILIFYSFKYNFGGTGIYLSKSELLQWIIFIRPLIIFGFDIQHELQATIPLFILILILLFAGIYNRLSLLKKSSAHNIDNIQKRYSTVNFGDITLLFSLLFLALLFLFPDSDGIAGFISLRLSTLFFLFLLCWLSIQPFTPKFLKLPLVIFFICYFRLSSMNISTQGEVSKTAENIYEAGLRIKPNSVVLPLNWTGDWMKHNFLLYAGAATPMIMLEHGECGTGYFPLVWNNDNMPVVKMPSQDSIENCFKWQSGEQIAHGKIMIDYILTLNDNFLNGDSCRIKLKEIVKKNYELTYSNNEVKVYRINKTL